MHFRHKLMIAKSLLIILLILLCLKLSLQLLRCFLYSLKVLFKIIFTITKILSVFPQNKISPNNGILLKVVLIPNLFNAPLTSCSLTNLDFLLLQIAPFDKTITAFRNFWIYTSVSFEHFKQYNSIFLIFTLKEQFIFYISICSNNSSISSLSSP